jgi:MFS superfamily sulfate permease-like transporter
MSDSDILSIQLWFGAAAIAVAAIAMTAAGWNHRYFVRATFVLAAALAGVALFWRTISARIPDDASEKVLSVTSSPISWFVAFVAATAAMFLISRSKNTKRKIEKGGVGKDTQPTPDWPIFDLFSHFAPPSSNNLTLDGWNDLALVLRDGLALGRLGAGRRQRAARCKKYQGVIGTEASLPMPSETARRSTPLA